MADLNWQPAVVVRTHTEGGVDSTDRFVENLWGKVVRVRETKVHPFVQSTREALGFMCRGAKFYVVHPDDLEKHGVTCNAVFCEHEILTD